MVTRCFEVRQVARALRSGSVFVDKFGFLSVFEIPGGGRGDENNLTIHDFFYLEVSNPI